MDYRIEPQHFTMETNEIIVTLSKSISAMSFEKISSEMTFSKQKSIHSSYNNKNNNIKTTLYAYMMVEAFMNGYVDLVTFFPIQRIHSNSDREFGTSSNYPW